MKAKIFLWTPGILAIVSILFIVASLAGAVFFDSFAGNAGSLIVISPFFLSGVLLIVSGFFFRNKK